MQPSCAPLSQRAAAAQARSCPLRAHCHEVRFEGLALPQVLGAHDGGPIRRAQSSDRVLQRHDACDEQTCLDALEHQQPAHITRGTDAHSSESSSWAARGWAGCDGHANGHRDWRTFGSRSGWHRRCKRCRVGL